MNNTDSTRLIINYEAGLSRFMGRDEMYKKYIRMFKDQNDFKELGEGMKSQNYAVAFRASHNLRGSSGNLSFDRFYEKICILTEMLRGEKDIPGAIFLFSEIEDEYKLLMSEIEKY